MGVLLEFVLALSVIGIAALLLPVLRPHGEGMAVGYVAVRTVEATFILMASTTALLVLALSQDSGQFRFRRGGTGGQRAALGPGVDLPGRDHARVQCERA